MGLVSALSISVSLRNMSRSETGRVVVCPRAPPRAVRALNSARQPTALQMLAARPYNRTRCACPPTPVGQKLLGWISLSESRRTIRCECWWASESQRSALSGPDRIHSCSPRTFLKGAGVRSRRDRARRASRPMPAAAAISAIRLLHRRKLGSGTPGGQTFRRNSATRASDRSSRVRTWRSGRPYPGTGQT